MMIATLLVPANVLAYSYGDPTKEDVAETFILIKAKLSASPADWSAAHEAYKVRRSEISSHFGESIAVTLDQNFEMKEKELVNQNYRYVLYLNLKRRFDYAEKDIESDYAKVKTLLGKAKGTFDVLKPHVESKIPNETSKLVSAFDLALEAIGNPGLFGMGKEPVKPEEFKKQTTYILTTLKPLFTYTASTPVQEEKKDAGESTETKQQQDTTQKDETKSDQTTTKETTSASSEEQAKLSNQDENTDENTVANADTENQETEENKTTEQEEETTTNEETATNRDNVTEPTEEQTIEASTEVEEVASQITEENTDKQIASGNTEHAPMEQVDRTNPVFTVIIILSVLVVLIGSIWFARKKNFI
jgi:chemotaxis protein histidine kinase CheA